MTTMVKAKVGDKVNQTIEELQDKHNVNKETATGILLEKGHNCRKVHGE